jgi:hypothetical protein
MRGRIVVLALIVLVALAAPALAQQKYVSQFDVFTGYTFLNSPKINLFEPGFHTQFGMRRNTWLTLGFDYSITAGDMTLSPELLPDALQASLKTTLGQLAAAGKLPAGYVLSVPAHSNTQTFAAGPQVTYRGLNKVSLFIRPSMGAIRELATPKPKDAIATLVVQGLAPTGEKRDWQGFFGVGGGIDFNFSRHVALRVQADQVWDHLFNDILKNGRWTTRFSIGPAFNFGKNILEK